MNHSFNFCLTNCAVACCYDLCRCWLLSLERLVRLLRGGSKPRVGSRARAVPWRRTRIGRSGTGVHARSRSGVVVAWAPTNHSTSTSHNNSNSEWTWFLVGGRYRSSCDAMSDAMMCRSRPGDLIVLILICVNARFGCFCASRQNMLSSQKKRN